MFKEIDGKVYFLLDITDSTVINLLLNYYEEIKFTNPELAEEINKRLNDSFINQLN